MIARLSVTGATGQQTVRATSGRGGLERWGVSREWLWERRALRTGDIARELGCVDHRVVERLFAEAGVPRWRSRTGELELPPGWLEAQLEERDMFSISCELGLDPRAVQRYAAKHGIRYEKAKSAHKRCPCRYINRCRVIEPLGEQLPCEYG